VVDFQQQLEALKDSLTNNMGTGKDSTQEDEEKNSNTEQKKDLQITNDVESTTKISEKIIEIPLNIIETSSPNLQEILQVQELHHLEERVTQLEIQLLNLEEKNIDSINNIKKEIKIEEEPLEFQLFISMLDIYLYSVVINPKLQFQTPLYHQYKEKLTIISQNILANSFRFFEKDFILEETIQIGIEIQETYNLKSKSLNNIQNILIEMKETLNKPSYQKNLYFAKFLNERGLILNAVAMINEILGEYIVTSAQNLSGHAKDRIAFHLNRIDCSQTSRRAYYHFYKSASNFFYTQFNTQTDEMETTFFPYKDTGNEEIELQFKRMFQSNKRNKANLFSLYSEMIYRIKIIRNDLVHGNNQRYYHNISYEIEDVLIDFEYLAIRKNFLGA